MEEQQKYALSWKWKIMIYNLSYEEEINYIILLGKISYLVVYSICCKKYFNN